jgi:hypothetical protein
MKILRLPAEVHGPIYFLPKLFILCHPINEFLEISARANRRRKRSDTSRDETGE